MRLSRRHVLQSLRHFGRVILNVAHARSYPNRQIKFVLAEAAGSSNDVVARIVANPYRRF